MCAVVVDGNKAANAFFKNKPSENVWVSEGKSCWTYFDCICVIIYHPCTSSSTCVYAFRCLFPCPFVLSILFSLTELFLSDIFPIKLFFWFTLSVLNEILSLSPTTLLMIMSRHLHQAVYEELEQVAWDLKAAQMEAGVDFPVHLSREAGGMVSLSE